MPEHPRFVVDSMLGHVARWLRLLGYDTLYFREIEDWRLLRIAEEEDRILLTRDLGLFRRARKRGLRALFIEDPSIEKVLALLSVRYGVRLNFDKSDTRCPECNARLRYTTSLVELAGRVSSYIATRYKEFWVCPSCGKVYWQGRHWKTIEKTLELARYERAKLQARLKPQEKLLSLGNTSESS